MVDSSLHDNYLAIYRLDKEELIMNVDVIIDIKLPIITNNFNIVKTQLIDGLKQYDLAVD